MFRSSPRKRTYEGCYGATMNEEVEKSEVRGETRGGDGDTGAGRRVLSGGNLNLQDRQGGNGAQSCLARGAMRRLGQGSARKHRGPGGPSWPRGRACRLCGLQGFWGQHGQVPVYHSTCCVIAPPAALALWRSGGKREPTGRKLHLGPPPVAFLPPSLRPLPDSPGLLGPCGLCMCMWPERDQKSVGWIPG